VTVSTPPLYSLAGWRYPRTQPSLPESHATVRVPRTGAFWRKALAFAGPGYMVAVGYGGGVVRGGLGSRTQCGLLVDSFGWQL
jgi:hypothetical protein